MVVLLPVVKIIVVEVLVAQLLYVVVAVVVMVSALTGKELKQNVTQYGIMYNIANQYHI